MQVIYQEEKIKNPAPHFQNLQIFFSFIFFFLVLFENLLKFSIALSSWSSLQIAELNVSRKIRFYFIFSTLGKFSLQNRLNLFEISRKFLLFWFTEQNLSFYIDTKTCPLNSAQKCLFKTTTHEGSWKASINSRH